MTDTQNRAVRKRALLNLIRISLQEEAVLSSHQDTRGGAVGWDGRKWLRLFLSQSEKSWDSRADFIPSLYVFECVELELALTLAAGDDDPFDSDFSCPIKLHRGNVTALTSSLSCLSGTVPAVPGHVVFWFQLREG